MFLRYDIFMYELIILEYFIFIEYQLFTKIILLLKVIMKVSFLNIHEYFQKNGDQILSNKIMKKVIGQR